jgi:hypothetical protein
MEKSLRNVFEVFVCFVLQKHMMPVMNSSIFLVTLIQKWLAIPGT